MTLTETSRIAHGGLAELIADAIRAQRERFRRYGVYRQTLRELGEMSDRELDDIGVSRIDIRAISREAAHPAA